MRAFALERKHGVDHVLDHARAGDLAVFGDVADQDDGGARALGVADQRLRAAAHLRDRAGRRFDQFGPHGLDRIDDDQPRRLALGHGGDDVLDRGFGGEFDGFAQAQPLGAQPHLRDRFLAGDVDRAVAGARERGGGLQQQRRFADAGIARHQQHRAAHEAAAGDAVEFGDAAGQARGLMRLAGERLEREQAAFAGFAPGPGGRSAPSSASVFHSPQASHLPCQRGAAAPQFWQMKLRLRLDTGIAPVLAHGRLKRP